MGCTQNATSKPNKKDNDTITMKFLLHKDRKEIGKPTAHNQEFGYPTLQSDLRRHAYAFFLYPRATVL
jgi:hypothetical protein